MNKLLKNVEILAESLVKIGFRELNIRGIDTSSVITKYSSLARKNVNFILESFSGGMDIDNNSKQLIYKKFQEFKKIANNVKNEIIFLSKETKDDASMVDTTKKAYRVYKNILASKDQIRISFKKVNEKTKSTVKKLEKVSKKISKSKNPKTQQSKEAIDKTKKLAKQMNKAINDVQKDFQKQISDPNTELGKAFKEYMEALRLTNSYSFSFFDYLFSMIVGIAVAIMVMFTFEYLYIIIRNINSKNSTKISKSISASKKLSIILIGMFGLMGSIYLFSKLNKSFKLSKSIFFKLIKFATFFIILSLTFYSLNTQSNKSFFMEGFEIDRFEGKEKEESIVKLLILIGLIGLIIYILKSKGVFDSEK